MPNPKLDARFARYAVLAGAAIAAAKPTKASVITTLESTPIDFTSGFHMLDVNNDGFIDFYFTALNNALGTQATGFFSSLIGGSVVATSSGIVLDEFAVATGGLDVATLFAGQVIGPALTYQETAFMGSFLATGTLFAGLEFYDTIGQLHYGFAEFDPGQLLGYAYESAANTPITTFDVTQTTTPEPSSFALLALGAVGLAVLRQKRT
jgi:hypothetical protein